MRAARRILALRVITLSPKADCQDTGECCGETAALSVRRTTPAGIATTFAERND